MTVPKKHKMPEQVAIFAYSRQGCETARRIRDSLSQARLQCYTVARLASQDFAPIGQPSSLCYQQAFQWADALLFVGASGIAVRAIAPFVKDKTTDPAVLCVDELGHFVIPLLSGHIGGANHLAHTISQALGATPVITTATDSNDRFSVDDWAARQGYVLDSLALAKEVSAAILEGDVPLATQLPVVGPWPGGLVPGHAGPLGIYVGYDRKTPFDRTLRIIPRMLHLGIGCRRGISREAVAEAVEQVLEAHRLDRRAIASVASIELKAQEQGLLDYVREQGWPVQFHTAEALRAVTGDITPSAFVQQMTGVDNVCERAALLHGSRLIVRKTAHNGVTVAIGAEHLEVRFG